MAPPSQPRAIAPYAFATLHPCLLTSLLVASVAMPGCSDDDDNELAGPVIELSVRLVEKNDHNAFVDAHADYRAAFGAQSGAEDYRLFDTFFSGSAATVPNVARAYVELTLFDSEASYRRAVAAINADTNAAINATSTLESRILVRSPNGQTTLAAFDGAALEIAVRSVSAAQRPTYDAAQAAFLPGLTQIADTTTVEFEIIDAPPNTTAGFTAFGSSTALQQTQTYYTTSAEAAAFFSSFDLVSSQFASHVDGLQRIDVPSSFALNATSAPEDIVEFEHRLYVSDIATGAILSIDLFDQAAGATTFVAPEDPAAALPTTWGLRIDAPRRRLLVNANPNYGFDGNVSAPCELRAYDLATGALVDAWPLPEGTVGNAVVVDSSGLYYVGDIGPDTRIIRVDPDSDEVVVWADDASQTIWPDGGFGLGGIVYNSSDSIYGVASAGDILFRIEVRADGTPGPIERVNVVDADGNTFTGFAADGMTWAPDGTLLYALNDAGVTGANGIIYQVDFSSSTAGTIRPVQTELKDPSGVFATQVLGASYVFVNESQLGHAFGADEGAPTVPFRVLAFPR